MGRIFQILEGIQRERHWNDTELSKQLGVERSAFCRLKKRERPVNLNFVMGVARLAKYNPSLHEALWDYLTDSKIATG
jgi:hypothetical protein